LPEQFARLRDLLAGYSGVYLDTTRQRVLELGLARRLYATGNDMSSYERHLQKPAGRDELRQLAELVLNHETFFFRNGPHLRALQEVLLPEIHRRKPIGAPIRIWSAGCATGEEAYSLAIVAYETLGRPLARPVEIWATDLSESALQKARAGCYRGRAIGNLSPEILQRYFHLRDGGHVVGDALRSLVRFEPLNLLDPFPNDARGVDIIFCQNVTIYFQPPTCRSLIERFYDCLPVGGLLFLGFSETLWNIFDAFQSREVSGAYVYYKGSSDPPTPAETRNGAARSPGTTAQLDQRRAGPALSSSSSVEGRYSSAASVSRDYKRSVHDQGAGDVEHTASDTAALLRGRELLCQGQTAEALEALRRISPQSACASQALTLVARAHADRGDLDLAIAEVHRALEIDTLNEEAYLLLGVIYARQEQWRLAVQQLERARYLSPASVLVSFHLADAYRRLGRLEPAFREYRNTLRKLDAHPPDVLLDGVAAGWLRETCRRQLEHLPHST
jgi:chemotaxis protein methyltransferase CheR